MPTSKRREKRTEQKIEFLRKKEEEESIEILSKKYKIPYANLTIFPVETDAVTLVPETKAREAELAVFQISGRNIKVGIRNPELNTALALIKELKDKKYAISLFLISRNSLNRAWEVYKQVARLQKLEVGIVKISEAKLESLEKEISNIKDIKEKIEKTFDLKTVQTTEILEIILAGTLAVDASDVHIEPAKEDARIRFRIDGVLNDITNIPLKIFVLLLSRIKLVSELKLNIHTKAQDGRFTINIADMTVEVRSSILPGPFGENVVLRILNPKIIEITFEKLGMQPWAAGEIDNELKKPNGMILTTGPTGSGKTTTLYAFLKKIHTPSIKIITIEDPIEYKLKGVEQTQVDPDSGYTFATGLRSIVRQDPDIILVGEVRDFETAEAAMHASLTGHLVFSTLHTNDAAGTVPRLLDLGVKPAIIAPAINLSMAQRLVRRLCLFCRVKVNLNHNLKQEITRELKNFPKKILIPDDKEWQIFQANTVGCDKCNGIGYKGRIGVFEIILIDAKIEQLILKEPSEYEIKKEALQQGQINMRQDGLLKVLAGITDFGELERVVGSSNI